MAQQGAYAPTTPGDTEAWGGGPEDDMEAGAAYLDGGDEEEEEEEEVRLTREQLLHHLGRRRQKFRHLGSLPYTLLLLVVYTATLFAHMDIGAVHDVSRGVMEPLLAREFGQLSPRKTFADVRSVEDWWGWVDEALLPPLFNLTAALEHEIVGVVNGVPVYASTVREVPAIAADAVVVISVERATRTVTGVSSWETVGYAQGDTVRLEGATCGECIDGCPPRARASTRRVGRGWGWVGKSFD
jgi:hypothetical protein